jgi:exonuclease VII small subunit
MTAKSKNRNYNEIKTELDQALAWFDSDALDVDEAIEKYKKAIALTDELELYLKNAQNTITRLSSTEK